MLKPVGAPSEAATPGDSGLNAYVLLLGLIGIPADAAQLRHALGHDRSASAQDLLSLAKRQPGIRARRSRGTIADLARLKLPAAAHGPDGWFVIGRVEGDRALVSVPGEGDTGVRTLSLDELAARWDGELVHLSAVEEAGLALRPFSVRWFLPQIVRYRALFGEVLLLTLGMNLLGLLAPLFFQGVVDKVLVNDTRDTLRVLMIGLVIVSVWETLFGWLRTKLFSETSQRVDVELGAKLFRHLLGLPVSYFEVRRVGDIAMRVRQLEVVREFLANASLSVLIDPAFTLVFLAVIWLYSVKLFLVTLLAVPAYIVIAQAIAGPLRARVEEKFERAAANNALLVETVAGIETVKASAVEPRFRQRFEQQLAGYAAASQRAIDLANTGSQAIQLVAKLNAAALLYLGAGAVIDQSLTVGGLIACNLFAQRVASPVIRLAQLWQDFQQVRIAVDRLGDVLNQPVEPGAAAGGALPTIAGRVTFERVRFRYTPEGPWTLDGIDLDIPAGTSLGIVGTSGSGKSTLTKLLQRLHVAHAGRVLVDGIDIGQIDPAGLRRQVGVVLQDNVLFTRSVRENIALADPAMPLERVIAAATLAGAHEFIARLPRGYDTLIEERGANLSGGQRQRLAIARALVTSPRILILDEATAALDAESEAHFQVNLRAFAAGRTVIVIAHRLSAVRGCDQIVTLEAGRIVERGTHGELLSAGGRYAELHRRQSGLGLAA